jgi:hypothetical protein
MNKLTALIQGNDAFLRAAMSIAPHLLGNGDGKGASGFITWELLDCLGRGQTMIKREKIPRHWGTPSPYASALETPMVLKGVRRKSD